MRRGYVTGAVMVVLCYLLMQLVRRPLPGQARQLVRILGRHRRRGRRGYLVRAAGRRLRPALPDPRATFTGPLTRYSVTQVLCYVIGLLALVTVAHGNPGDICGTLMACRLG